MINNRRLRKSVRSVRKMKREFVRRSNSRMHWKHKDWVGRVMVKRKTILIFVLNVLGNMNCQLRNAYTAMGLQFYNRLDIINWWKKWKILNFKSKKKRRTAVNGIYSKKPKRWSGKSPQLIINDGITLKIAAKKNNNLMNKHFQNTIPIFKH